MADNKYIDSKTRRVYHVFSRKKNVEKAIEEVARERKYGKNTFKVIPVWVSGDDLYLSHRKGSEKYVAVTRA